MFPINQFVVKKVKENSKEGTFHIGPLPKGYGHTVGNIYRRILLSSIQGAAITSVKISGVQHEYTTQAGMKDDILTIILALKNVSVVSHSDDPVTVNIEVKGNKSGPKVVTAGDIGKNPMIEIVNPEHVITTLTDAKAEFKAELTIERGFGYSMPNEGVRKEVGTIPVDGNFTPVKFVSLNVGQTRVGQQTDLDLAELEIITNGAITPSAALHQAAEILSAIGDHLTASTKDLLSTKSKDQVEASELPISVAEEKAQEEVEPLKVVDLDLPTRLTNALLNGGYEDLWQLNGLTEEEVSNIKGMGEISFSELKKTLTAHGINLI